MAEFEETDWKRLASETANWMRRVGAVHSDERHERAYVTSQDWEEEFADLYGVTAADLGTVVQYAHRLNRWIAFEPFKGWFLTDDPRYAATVVTRLINYMTSLAATINNYIEAMGDSGRIEEISAGFVGRIHKVEIDGIAPLLDKAGVKVTDNIRIKLIEAKIRHGSGDNGDAPE